MDKLGFIDFNTRLSPENSGKADSYARAITILDEVLPHQNAIDLNGQSLYDKAFDKGLITISPDDYSICISSALREYETQEYYDRHFGTLAGRPITMPIEHRPNRDYLAYHRDHVFLGN